MIEAKIDQLIEALNKNTAALLASQPSSTTAAATGTATHAGNSETTVTTVSKDVTLAEPQPAKRGPGRPKKTEAVTPASAASTPPVTPPVTAPVTAPVTVATGSPTITLDSLRGVADQLLQAGKQPFIYELVRKHGAENLRTLSADKYAAVHEAMLTELVSKSVTPEPPVETVEEKAPTVAPEPEITLEALKDIGIRVRDLGYASLIKEIAVKHGAQRLTEIPVSAYPEAFEALVKIEAQHLEKAA